MLENSVVKSVISIILLLIWLVFYIFNEFEYVSIIGAGSVILLQLLSILLIVRAVLARNIALVVVFSFIYLYTIPPVKYFFHGIYLSGYNTNYTYDSLTNVNLIFSLFLLVVFIILKLKRDNSNSFLLYEKNDIIFYCLYVISFIIIILSKRTGSVYDGSGDVVEMSSLNEYVIIIFLLLYIYSFNEKFKLLLLWVIFGLYALFALISGGRIEVVLLILMLISVHFRYTIAFKKIIFYFIIGVWMMTIFGNIRANPMLLLQGNFIDICFSSDSDVHINQAQNTNESDVYWASERLLILMQENELLFQDRVEAGLAYIISPLVPNSILPATGNLSTFKKDLIGTGGGGLAPVFIFVMFGSFGVIFLGIFVAKVLNNIGYNNSNKFKYIYTILMIVSLPRWFAYYPVHLIKFCVIGVFFYYIIKSIDYTIKLKVNSLIR